MKYSEILQTHLQNHNTAILYKIQFTYFLIQNYGIQYVHTWNKIIYIKYIKYELHRKYRTYLFKVFMASAVVHISKNNISILNGRFGNDRGKGGYTFRNVSVIDYMLATADTLKILSSFSVVETDPLFSDGHSLLSCLLSFVDQDDKHTTTTTTTTTSSSKTTSQHQDTK